ncbi:tRNA dimethylallyltransferase-like [Lineus longissimus]|uniref:tRNA dimethylallyltransferase-like n=1 Tax=Lineus longissimus TaxID=88925 RepID=UPI002B4F7CCE
MMAVSSAQILKHVPVVVVLGATGTGKSKLALNIASRFSAEIISADSMQVYKGLDIITNKVTQEEQAECIHHMIGYIDPLHQTHKVTNFRDKALPIIDSILSRNKLPIIVGGTNYYIEALLWKFLVDKQKASPPRTRDRSPLTTRSSPMGNSASSSANSPRQPSEETSEHGRNFDGERDDTNSSTDFASLDNEALHRELERVDPVTALRLHPADRRKVVRALEVYHQNGQPLSEILSKQHEDTGASAISGPLRYDNTCIFWVQCDQKVLEERLDARVDDMIRRGLVKELLDFHEAYNRPRVADNKVADYTLGIFQSIGFKEFHDYLILPEEERGTAHAQKLLQQGIDQLKLVTRQYARKQRKWIRNRFLRRPGSSVPPVYGVDSTNPENWEIDALKPALEILSAIVKGETPSIQPLPCEAPRDEPEHHICDICGGRIFVSKLAWEAHLNGKKHKNLLRKKRQLERQQAEDAIQKGNTEAS